MSGRDPRFVVGRAAGGDGGAVSANYSGLFGGCDLLGGASGGAFGALAAETAALLLGEEGGDPGGVDEVAGSAEDTGEDEVEEDAAKGVS